MLVSGYPTHDYLFFNEIMSDNFDRYPRYPYTTVLADSTWRWNLRQQTGTFSPSNLWSDCFEGVTVANMCLEAIEKLGGPKTTVLREARAEALMLRAYNHFLLACTFCAPFDKTKNAKNLGLPYQYEVERSLSPHYERGTLDVFYEKIQKDLEEALPLIAEDNYTVPKYHFNINASYAFATRFYLFTEQWEKAIECANIVLGSNPKSVLRDWELMSNTARDRSIWAKQWIETDDPSNLMIATTYGNYRNYFGNNSTISRYSHGALLATTETLKAPNFMFTNYSASKGNPYLSWPFSYTSNTLDRVLWFKHYYDFEYTNIVKGTGYSRTVYVPLTGDEVLLSRAEAYIMLGEYDKALVDMNLWASTIFGTYTSMTLEGIKNYMTSRAYYTSTSPSIKKHLNPSFDIGEEGGDKESMLQALLFIRRIAGFYEGWRWWDIRRYGIVIYRRDVSFDGESVESVIDELKVDDPRRTVQIPQRSVDAGFQPNP
jgi:hypothetical protein